VREALNRLEAEGLVCIEPRRGAYVRQFFREGDTRPVRTSRSPRSPLHRGGQRHTKAAQRSIFQHQPDKKFLKDGNKLEHIEEDMRFHAMITAATGNEELCRVLENIQQKTLLCRSKSYELSATTAPVAHMKIYQALKKETKREARLAMREHIVFVRERLLASFKTSS